MISKCRAVIILITYYRAITMIDYMLLQRMKLHGKKLQSLIHINFIHRLHIPSHIVENWDASSYTPLWLSLAHMIQGHMYILTLEMEFVALAFR